MLFNLQCEYFICNNTCHIIDKSELLIKLYKNLFQVQSNTMSKPAEESTLSDKPIVDQEYLQPIILLSTEGSHPLLCLPCDESNKQTPHIKPTPQYKLISDYIVAYPISPNPMSPGLMSPHPSVPNPMSPDPSSPDPMPPDLMSPVTPTATPILQSSAISPTCTPQSTNGKGSTCPNRIVDFENLKSTVDKHPGFCQMCKKRET